MRFNRVTGTGASRIMGIYSSYHEESKDATNANNDIISEIFYVSCGEAAREGAIVFEILL